MSEISKEVMRRLDEIRSAEKEEGLRQEQKLQKERETKRKKEEQLREFILRLKPREILESFNKDILAEKGAIIERENLSFRDKHDVNLGRDRGTRSENRYHTRSSLALVWKGKYKEGELKIHGSQGYTGQRLKIVKTGKDVLFGILEIGIEDDGPFAHINVSETPPSFRPEDLRCTLYSPTVYGIGKWEIENKGIEGSLKIAKDMIVHAFACLISRMEEPLDIGRFKK